MKEYLSRRGIVFEDRDIRQDDEALKELVNTHNSRMTPTLVIGGQVIIGFDREKIDALLAE